MGTKTLRHRLLLIWTTLFAVFFQTQYSIAAPACNPSGTNQSKSQNSSQKSLREILAELENNMVWVEGGTFQMGATWEQGNCKIRVLAGGQDEVCPEHKITLDGFFICKYEVTQELWEAVMSNNPSVYKGTKKPVESVSWEDCQKFINQLNRLTGKKYRLPTEAEWEFAARGGLKSKHYKYSGSFVIEDVAWYKSNSDIPGVYIGTHDVGLKQPNELGLYDMSGNVSEWCLDAYDDNYYLNSPIKNPLNRIINNSKQFVARGGNWRYDDSVCKVSHREHPQLNYKVVELGLRLVRQ